MPYRTSTTKTRREFLKQFAITSGIFTLGSCIHQSKTNTDGIAKLKKTFAGNIIVPTDATYETLRKTRSPNALLDKRPALIAQCKNEQDILRCIDFAHEQQLEVAVRSGNHSFLGWGTCHEGLVIDLSSIKQIDVDPIKRTVRVMPGNTAEEILAATAVYGLAPALGQCGTVGAGLVLGGGLGFLAGKYGATCDTLLSAKMITPDNKNFQVNATTNEDLYWAIRGGGGNFGVVTEFEYQLYPESEIVTGSFIYAVDKTKHAIKCFADFMQTAPDELQGDFYYTKQGREMAVVKFVYAGDLSEGEQVLNGFRSMSKPDQHSIRRRSYAEIYSFDDDAAASESLPACSYSSLKGIYYEKLSDELIDSIVDRLNKAPPSCNLFLNLSHYMHGQVCRVAPNATAFELRKEGAVDSVFMIGWNDPRNAAAAIDWLNDLAVKHGTFSGGRIYSNYMSVEGGDLGKEIYGTNRNRLLQLKQKYDADNFFHLNHNIQPKSLS
jgi:hypothetical protein